MPEKTLRKKYEYKERIKTCPKKYTVEDLRRLAGMMDDFIIKIASGKLGKNDRPSHRLNTILSFDTKDTNGALKEWLECEEDHHKINSIVDFLFFTPLKEMPLHMNDQESFTSLIRIFAKWRIEVGK